LHEQKIKVINIKRLFAHSLQEVITDFGVQQPLWGIALFRTAKYAVFIVATNKNATLKIKIASCKDGAKILLFFIRTKFYQ
jgi:hypothetical protein